MQETKEDYRFQAHEMRITNNESKIYTLENTVSAILSNQAVTNERLLVISKQLDNGIKSKLEKFDKDINEIMPLVRNKAELEKTVRNAIIILSCGGASSLIIYIIKIYLNGQ